MTPTDTGDITLTRPADDDPITVAAEVLFATAMRMSTSLRHDGETDAQLRSNAIGHALQALIQAAGDAMVGVTQEEMFVGLAIGGGAYLQEQTLGERRAVARQLVDRMMKAAEMREAAIALESTPPAGEA